MSEKRWALRLDCEWMKPIGSDSNAALRKENFEQVHTYDPATESAVPHDVLRWAVSFIEDRTGGSSALSAYLPKQKPTLREAMADCGFLSATDRDGAFDRACRDAGVDPDERRDP